MSRRGRMSERRGDSSASCPVYGVEQLLTIRSFADVLGISEKTARRLVWTGRIPCVRIGRVVRLDPADVSRFVAARKE